MNQLFLDDIRDPSWVYGLGADSRWDVVRSHAQFTAWLTANGLPDRVSFDHDLGGVDEEGNEVDPATVPTGMDCAHALVNYCMDHGLALPAFEVHSANGPGAANIRGLLESFQRHQAQDGVATTPSSAAPASFIPQAPSLRKVAMSRVILSFHLPNSTCVEYAATVDTLDPIGEFIDDGNEAPFPSFQDALGLDSSFQSGPEGYEFIYDLSVKKAPDLATARAVLEPFLRDELNIAVQKMVFVPQAPPAPVPPRCAPRTP